MKSPSLLIVAAAALLITGAVAVALKGKDVPEDLTAGAFAKRLPHSLALPDSKLGINQRVTELSPDRIFPKDANVDFQNGDTGREYYRDNGTLERIEVFYKQLPGQAQQLKWRAVMLPDGIRTMEDSAFWPDGTRRRIGTLLGDDSYSVVTYFQDGTTENTRTLLHPDGSALYHRIQSETGILLYIGEKTNEGIEEKNFAPNGNPVKYSLRKMFESRKIEYYGETGIPKMDLSMNSYLYTAIYYAPDGKTTEKRLISFGGMTVIVYEAGVAKYAQSWQRMNPFDAQKGAESVWQLYSVARIDDAEQSHWKLWFRTGDDYVGKHVPYFIYESKDGMPTASSKLVQVTSFNEQGCMFHRVLQDAQYGNALKTEKFTTDRGCSTIPLPLELMKELPFTPFTDKIPQSEPHAP
jgi:hypothetical protein